MPPPRLVKRNSKSELRSVSTFSSKAGTDSAPCGAASGVASGDGEGARTAGVAVGKVCPGVAVTWAGLGAICFARYISHTTSPTTQRATTIHAVRSINSVLHDLRRSDGSRSEIRLPSAAAPGRTHIHPMVGSERGASVPASFRAERHALPPLPENISNRLG